MPTARNNVRGCLDFLHMLSLSGRANRKPRLMLMITKRDFDLANYVFADESGKFKDKNLICLCGYLSSGEKWDLFTCKWKELTDEIKIPAVHTKTFYQDCKEAGLSKEQTAHRLEQFIDIVRESISVGFAVGLDARYYRGMPKAAKEGLGDPGVACLQRLLRLIRNRLRSIGYNYKISITLDDDVSYAMKFYNAISRLRTKDKELGRMIGAVSFADDSFIVPLQAADILANLTTKWFQERMAGNANADEPPPLLKRLLLSPEKGYGLEYKTELWNDSELRKHLHNFVKWSGDG